MKVVLYIILFFISLIAFVSIAGVLCGLVIRSNEDDILEDNKGIPDRDNNRDNK